MKILIAESKTMAPCLAAVSRDDYLNHRAKTDSIATSMMRQWGEWNLGEIASRFKLSAKLARSMQNYIYDFPNKTNGEKAIEAFTGVVFKAFDYASLSQEEKETVQNNVRIVSSLYGLLLPEDIIKPYRLDFTSKVSPTGGTMADYWKMTLKGMLGDTLGDDTEILDLLPGDAAKCIDWRTLPMLSRMKVDFKEVKASETGDGTLSYKTPIANKLKMLRGKLLRHIIKEGIDSFDALRNFEGPDFQPDPELSSSTNLVMLTD